MPRREKTDSLTKLCKIIALEVNKPRFDRLERKINQFEDRIESAVLGGAAELIESVKSSLESAGGFWNNAEDYLLADEVRMAIAVIAKNHHRSSGAIKARINQNELI